MTTVYVYFFKAYFNITSHLYLVGRDSTVGTVTRYGLDGPRFETR